MPIIRSRQKTKLKKYDLDSSQLVPSEYFEVESGAEVACEILSIRTLPGSRKIKLAGNAGLLRAGQEYFIHADHWVLPTPIASASANPKPDNKSKILLNVPYFCQNDNELWQGAGGNVQCCPTANAMLAAYKDKGMIGRAKANGFAEPESYYKWKFLDAGFSASDRGDHNCHTYVLDHYFGIQSEWRTDLTSQQIVQSIDDDNPLVIGVEFKSAGHIFIVVGYYTDEGGGLLIHDPFGRRAGASDSYSYVNPGWGDETGKADRYSWGLLNKIVFDQPNKGAWGRKILS